MLDDAKNEYFRGKIADSDSRELFKLIRDNFGQGGQKILPTNCDAQAFMLFFNNKIATLRQAMDTQAVSVSQIDELSSELSLTSWSRVSPEEVRKIINTSPCKSSHMDPIPAWLFRSCLEALLPTVTLIINASLSTAVVPDCFKRAVISPLIKKPALDREVLANYRPVSNLSYLSKCLERVVASQLHRYLDSHPHYDRMQSAYRSHHSTETTLLMIQNDLLMAADSGSQVLLLMLDLSAAFDTIDHAILLHRLECRFGIHHSALQWLRSYLQDRTQTLAVGGSSSDVTSLECGVPQGSVLGPVLFNLYMAPLGDLIASHGISYLCYADDTQMYVTLEDSSSLEQFQLCIRDVRNWMLTNRLKLNDNKTDMILFSSRFKPSCSLPSLHVGDTTVVPSLAVNDLGVTLDCHLTLGAHVQRLCRSATYGLRSIARIRKHLDQPSCERLIHAYVTSKLDYCNSLLFGLPSEKLDLIQRIQNNAARLVTRTRRTEHITPVLINLHWLPVRRRIDYKILLITFSVLHHGVPGYLRSQLHLRSSSRSLRSSSSQTLLVPRTKTKSYGDRAFAACAPRLWNHLPDHIKNSDNIDIFKTKLKTYLFETAYLL